jgi:hypothetical protein
LFIFTIPQLKSHFEGCTVRKTGKRFTAGSNIEQTAIAPDGTTCLVSFQMLDTQQRIIFDTVAAPNVITLPVTCDMILQLSARGEFDSGVWERIHRSSKNITCMTTQIQFASQRTGEPDKRRRNSVHSAFSVAPNTVEPRSHSIG